MVEAQTDQTSPAPRAHGVQRGMGVAIALTIGLAITMTLVLVVYEDPLEFLGGWGYPGAFLVMLVNNLTIILPALGPAFIAAAAQSLDPWLLGIVGGLGAAVGETSAYIVGRSAGAATVQRRLPAVFRRSVTGRHRLFGGTIFLFALTPLPFDLAGLVAGAVRYPFRWFFVWLAAGKVINTILVALASYYTIGWLDRLFS